ncbi:MULTISPECIES: hypothetical protein [unclassified Cupriavidus]|uniref:hypothetical protein n=1 Tax=unclassified Cupriavidus TaxID=2640874 RepID=UPI0013661492|nr:MULTISPECIES: hypothetical protein [unclassified Cupriavidus]
MTRRRTVERGAPRMVFQRRSLRQPTTTPLTDITRPTIDSSHTTMSHAGRCCVSETKSQLCAA